MKGKEKKTPEGDPVSMLQRFNEQCDALSKQLQELSDSRDKELKEVFLMRMKYRHDYIALHRDELESLRQRFLSLADDVQKKRAASAEKRDEAKQRFNKGLISQAVYLAQVDADRCLSIQTQFDLDHFRCANVVHLADGNPQAYRIIDTYIKTGSPLEINSFEQLYHNLDAVLFNPLQYGNTMTLFSEVDDDGGTSCEVSAAELAHCWKHDEYRVDATILSPVKDLSKRPEAADRHNGKGYITSYVGDSENGGFCSIQVYWPDTGTVEDLTDQEISRCGKWMPLCEIINRYSFLKHD